MSEVLRVDNVGKSYQEWRSEWLRVARWFGFPVAPAEEHWVLNGVSFSIAAGESVGIVGRNGAGKSTLLKLVTGTLQPNTGNISRNGRIAAILELGMGFNPDLTGRQNVRHVAGLMGFPQAQIDALMPDIQDFAEVGEYFDHPVRTYSSGMQVRIAFAVATAVRPDVLIVDEALSVGDAYFQAKCYSRVRQFQEQGTSLILVSHAVGDIVKHCDRAIFIKDGRVFADGPSRDVSNIYLDELFGKRRDDADADPQDLSAENALADLSREEIADRYAERRGYNANEHRWGHGGAKIIDYVIASEGEVSPARLTSGARVTIGVKFYFETEFENVVPGLLLKTIDGVFLYGTNSFLASDGGTSLKVKAGEVVTCSFALPMSVNEGVYLLSLGISAGDPQGELLPLDRRYDSIFLDVSRPMQFWGIVDLNADFAIEGRTGGQ